MRLDLIEVKPKRNKLKTVAFVILIIFCIAFFSILGIYGAKLYKGKLIAEKRKEINQQNNINTYTNQMEMDVNQIENEVKIVTPTIEDREQFKRTQLPVYSENAKQKMKNIYKGNSKVAYLTFDDGPSQAVTPLILDLLKQENIKATFFVLGNSVKNNPELVKREYAEGHYIANHGFGHNYSKIYAKPENVLSEYNKTEEYIKKAIGNKDYSSHLFRFPGGYYGGKYAKVKKEAGKLLNSNNISYIDWNVLTGDAEGANTKEKIMKYIEKYTKDKGPIVVLMHDASSKILTYETLKDVIDYLREQGYTFKNFYDIMQ